MAFTAPLTRLDPIEVFSVDAESAQVTWRNLPAGRLEARVHDGRNNLVELGESGRPGAASIWGLPSESHIEVEFLVNDQPVARWTIPTPTALKGPVLSKIATINDLHLGEEEFGVVRKFRDSVPHEPYALRCAIAAVKEAEAWGAQMLVIKGDITELSRPADWELFDRLLAETSVPVVAIPGNHDTAQRADSIDGVQQLCQRGLFEPSTHSVDIAGTRLVLVDTTVPGRAHGRISHRTDEVCSAVDVDTSVLVFTHHHFEPRTYPSVWPRGVRKFDHLPTLEAVRRTNPSVVVSTGHTHRNRAHRRTPVLVSEVSSTKDFPGVWAGYTIHADGIRQTVRRIEQPSCLAWNEQTHQVIAGLWGRWTPGRLSDRCFTHQWESRSAADESASVRFGQPVPSSESGAR